MTLTARTMNPIDYSEALAREFYRHHFMMAPGKDEPAAMNSPHSREARRFCYSAFLSALGPIDVACVLSLYLLRQRRE
jgi:hypothetical protein